MSEVMMVMVLISFCVQYFGCSIDLNPDFLPTLYLLRLVQSLPSFVLHLPEGRVINKPSFEIRSPKYISCQFCALYLHIYFWSIIKCQMYCNEYLETKTSEKLLCLTKVQYSIFVVVKQLRKHTFFNISFSSAIYYYVVNYLERNLFSTICCFIEMALS